VRANDAVIGALLIAAALAMIGYTTTFPAFPGQNYGPSLFPRILGTGIIICGGFLILSGLRTRAANAPWFELAPWARETNRAGAFLLVLALLVFYILASDRVGFIPVAIVLLGILMLWLGVKPLTAGVTAIVTTFLMHWFFETLLRVPLPRGWLTNLL
jgi:putative tricarboxylic transport membrane protein